MKTNVNTSVHISEPQEAKAHNLGVGGTRVSVWLGYAVTLYGHREHILDTLRNAMVAVQALEEES